MRNKGKRHVYRNPEGGGKRQPPAPRGAGGAATPNEETKQDQHPGAEGPGGNNLNIEARTTRHRVGEPGN